MSVAAVGGAVVGGLFAADAASSAAGAQSKAAKLSTAEQKRQFDLTRADNAPWMNAGTAGVNRLQYLLGLDANIGGPSGGSNFLTRDQIASQLRPSFTSSVRRGIDTPQNAYLYGDVDRNGPTGQRYKSVSVVDDAALNAAVAKQWDEQEAKRAEMLAAAQADPNFGSLLREYDANAFWNDDATQLGLEYGRLEGRKAIDRMASASGGFQNGKTARALERFGQDYMSTKFDQGFNRDQSKKSSTYNMLAGISGTGQTAAAQVNAAGQNMANNVSSNIIGAGNARAASSIGQANAINGAISNGFNMYQQNKLYNSLGGGGGGGVALPEWPAWNN